MGTYGFKTGGRGKGTPNKKKLLDDIPIENEAALPVKREKKGGRQKGTLNKATVHQNNRERAIERYHAAIKGKMLSPDEQLLVADAIIQETIDRNWVAMAYDYPQQYYSVLSKKVQQMIAQKLEQEININWNVSLTNVNPIKTIDISQHIEELPPSHDE